MSVIERFGKKTIILLAALVIIGGAAAYLLFFADMGNAPSPQPEKIVKRIKIEAPPIDAQEAMPVQEEKDNEKPVEVKAEPNKQEEIKTVAKEVVPEKKEVVKKGKQKPAADKKMAYKPWAVHVASYVSKAEALSMVKKLKQDRYKAYMTEFRMRGKQWYRVRVGFYASYREAKTVGQKISGSYSISSTWPVKPKKNEIMSHH
jgi:cell division septation protein DedD